MLPDIAKFHGIIKGRKRENEIKFGGPLPDTVHSFLHFFNKYLLNTATDIAVNSHDLGFYGLYIVVGQNTS